MHNQLNPGASCKALKNFILSKHCTSVWRVTKGCLIKQHYMLYLSN